MVKPGYKQTEVGVAPDDWRVVPIEALAALSTGRTPPTSDASNYGDRYLFVSPADIGTQKYVSRTAKMLSSRGFAISPCFPAGSILFVCIGSTIGKCAIAATELTTNQQINAVVPNDGVSHDYLYYSLNRAAPRIRARAGEQAVPIVNKTEFGCTLILLPPTRAEQEAIATALSDVDALIEALERLIAKKRRIKQGAMQELLTGKRRLPGFGGEWRTYRFHDVFRRLNAKDHQILASDYQSSGSYPVVDQGQEYIVGYTDRADRVFSCPIDGVIVFGDHTCIVKHINFDFAVGADGTQLLSPRCGHSSLFHAYLLQHNPIRSTGYNRHFKFLVERDYRAPGAEAEQEAIATVLSDMDAEIEALEAKLTKTRQLKQGMMHELLTGRIRLV